MEENGGSLMVFYPAASNHNIPPGDNDPPITPRIVVLHTMVGSIQSAENHFKDGSGIEAHFGVAMDGRVWQWRDTDRQADAQAAGNDYCISIETEDGGDPSRPWTPQQLLQLDLLITWIGRIHSIPMRLVSSTGERGIGYHRQFPEWNPHNHSCPGDVRLRQLLDALIPGLQQPDSPPLEEADLTKDEFIDAWKSLTAEGIIPGQTSWADYFRVSADRQAQLINALAASNGKVDGLRDALTTALAETNAKLDELIVLLTPPPAEPEPEPQP